MSGAAVCRRSLLYPTGGIDAVGKDPGEDDVFSGDEGVGGVGVCGVLAEQGQGREV